MDIESYFFPCSKRRVQCQKAGAAERRKSLLVAMLGSLLFFCSPASAGQSEAVSFHLLDVGQGEAMIIHQPGACTMLVDTGLPIYAERVTAALRELQAVGLDMAMITHHHVDHFGGLEKILEEFPAQRLFDNGAEKDGSAEFSSYAALRNLLPYQRLDSGASLRCGDVEIDILHPFSVPDPAANPNDTSLVLMFSYHDFRLLHMGDLAGQAAKSFLEIETEPRSDLRADVLKIAHHGYEDAASAALLELVAPYHALISTSGTSCIGTACSPADSVLKRLDDYGIPYFRTDRDGDITIFVTDSGYRISTSSVVEK